jgi:hypothetical protein
VGMAVTMGGVSSALVGFNNNDTEGKVGLQTQVGRRNVAPQCHAALSMCEACSCLCPCLQGALISKGTIEVITIVYAPIGMFILVYALWSYELRSRFMRKKQVHAQAPFPAQSVVQHCEAFIRIMHCRFHTRI